MSKKALSAKLDNSLLAEADRLAHHLKIPRNRAIEEGLRLWVRQKYREAMTIKMKEASLATRKEGLTEAKTWESILGDGLDEQTEWDDKK